MGFLYDSTTQTTVHAIALQVKNSICNLLYHFLKKFNTWEGICTHSEYLWRLVSDCYLFDVTIWRKQLVEIRNDIFMAKTLAGFFLTLCCQYGAPKPQLLAKKLHITVHTVHYLHFRRVDMGTCSIPH